MVRTGERVTVDYRLRLDDGTVYVDTAKRGEPFSFVVGTGAMLPDFECAVMGMDVGETRSIHVPVERAYGERDDKLVVCVPAVQLPSGEPLPEGAVIGMSTPEGVMRAKVLRIEGDEAVLDCNHELAGKALDFDITLVAVEAESAVEREKHAQGCTCGCDRLQEALS